MEFKITRLNAFYRQKRKQNYVNKYFCKSRSYKANFSDCLFKNVNFRGSILTSCFFKNAIFDGTEFIGTNLKKSCFKGAEFKHAIFVGALLNDCNFTGAKFQNTIFVNTNIKHAKGLDTVTQGITILNKYPEIPLSIELENAINDLRANKHVEYFKVLHLNSKKMNALNISILQSKFNEKTLLKGLAYAKDKINNDMTTIGCLIAFLLKNRSVYDNINSSRLTQSRG